MENHVKEYLTQKDEFEEELIKFLDEKVSLRQE